MEALSCRLQEQSHVDFDPIDHRILCFPHIINILVKHLLDEHQDADFSDVKDSWTVRATKVKKELYLAAVRGNTLQRARDVVNTIRVSNSRRNQFRDIIISGNQSELFCNDTGEKIQLPVVELLRDEKTRWDSTFIMINRLRNVRQVRVHLSKYVSWTNLSA
jgi:hypothetical protein